MAVRCASGLRVAPALRAGLELMAVVAVVAGCDDVSQHVYTGYLFDPVNGCVSSTSTAIDVIPGAATGDTCAPVCLTASSGAVYVSPVCGPYPQGTTVEAPDATAGASDPCTAALAAYDAPDGGGICGNAAGPTDGGDAGDAGDGGSAGDAGDAASAAEGGDAGDAASVSDGGDAQNDAADAAAHD